MNSFEYYIEYARRILFSFRNGAGDQHRQGRNGVARGQVADLVPVLSLDQHPWSGSIRRSKPARLDANVVGRRHRRPGRLFALLGRFRQRQCPLQTERLQQFDHDLQPVTTLPRRTHL